MVSQKLHSDQNLSYLVIAFDHFPSLAERELHGYSQDWPYDMSLPRTRWGVTGAYQSDLFRTLIERQRFYFQTNVEAHKYERTYVDCSPYLKYADEQAWLSVTYNHDTGIHEFWFCGTPEEYTWWNMRWADRTTQSRS